MNRSHRGLWLAHRLAFVVALGNAGCGNDCPKASRCNGDVLERCESGSGGPYASDSPCGPGRCITIESDVFCALDERPDARCLGGRAGVCDGAVLVSCYQGYVTAKYDCRVGASPQGNIVLTEGTSGACVDRSQSAQCVAEAVPDPNCQSGVSYSSRCSGNDVILCSGDYVIQRTPCGSAFCRQGSEAVCSLLEAPDPGCVANERLSSYCAEETLIQCRWDYRVSERPCSASEVCAEFSPANAVCTPPR